VSLTAVVPRGAASVVSKASTVSAFVFMLSSIALSVVATRGAGVSKAPVLERHGSRPAQTAPVTPQPAPQKK